MAGRGARAVLAIAGGLMAVVVGLGAVYAVARVRGAALRTETIDLQLASRESIVPTHSSEVAVSPDGRLIAYASISTMSGMAGMGDGVRRPWPRCR